ncbi:NIPA-like protein 3 [Physocladia obscura]|uniref:NIPA-like protein 3 n=1 Tax=Physocladia obscura TaxID=109957 RepID=A0AAD5SST4_9FUNG|nr:NIPA-like protein 3 [Physocladia obscura]
MGSSAYAESDAAAYLAGLCGPSFCTIASACSPDSTALFNPANPLQLPTFSEGQACCDGSPSDATCATFGTASVSVDTCTVDTSCEAGSNSTSSDVCKATNLDSTLWIGILITIIGAAANNIGLNLQKLALRKRNEKNDAKNVEKQVMRKLRIGALKFPDSFSNSVKRNLNALRIDRKYNRSDVDDFADAAASAAVVAASGGGGGVGGDSLDLLNDSKDLNSYEFQMRSRQNSFNQVASTAVTATTANTAIEFSGSYDPDAEDNLPITVVAAVVGEDQPDLQRNLQFGNLIKNPIWVVGLIIYVSANFLNFAALQFAPQSLVAPLGSISLVVNVIAAPLINKEKFTWKDVVGGVFIVGGSSMTVVFAGVSSSDYNLCILLKLFQRPATIVFLTVTMSCIVSTFFFICIVEKNLDHTPVLPAEVIGAAAATAENPLNPTAEITINKTVPTPSRSMTPAGLSIMNPDVITTEEAPATKLDETTTPSINNTTDGNGNHTAALEWTSALYRNVYIPTPIRKVSRLFQRPLTPSVSQTSRTFESPKLANLRHTAETPTLDRPTLSLQPPPTAAAAAEAAFVGLGLSSNGPPASFKIEEDPDSSEKTEKRTSSSAAAAVADFKISGVEISESGSEIVVVDEVITGTGYVTHAVGFSSATLGSGGGGGGGSADAISVSRNDDEDENSDNDIMENAGARAKKTKQKLSIWGRLYKLLPLSLQRWVDYLLSVDFIPVFRNKYSTNAKVITLGLPLAYASLGGLMGTTCTLFAKSTIHLLTNSFLGEDQFNSIYSWLIVGVTVFTALSQVYWINMGLQRYDALLQIPVFFVVWTVFDVVGGGVYFGEFDGFNARQYGLFSIAVGVIFMGVFVLADRLKRIDLMKFVGTLGGHTTAVLGLAAHAEAGKIAGGSGRGQLRVFDAETGATEIATTMGEGDVACADFCGDVGDAALLACGVGARVAVVDLRVAASASAAWSSHSLADDVASVRFSPSAAALLAAVDDSGAAVLFDLRRMDSPVASVASTATATATVSNTSVNTNIVVTLRHRWIAHGPDALCLAVAFAPPPRSFLQNLESVSHLNLWTGASDSTVRRWDYSRDAPALLQSYPLNGNNIKSQSGTTTTSVPPSFNPPIVHALAVSGVSNCVAAALGSGGIAFFDASSSSSLPPLTASKKKKKKKSTKNEDPYSLSVLPCHSWSCTDLKFLDTQTSNTVFDSIMNSSRHEANPHCCQMLVTGGLDGKVGLVSVSFPATTTPNQNTATVDDSDDNGNGNGNGSSKPSTDFASVVALHNVSRKVDTLVTIGSKVFVGGVSLDKQRPTGNIDIWDIRASN